MTDNLNEALAFTSADLASNHKGYLSQTQRLRLSKKRLETLFIGLIIGIPVIASGLYNLYELIRNNNLSFDSFEGFAVPLTLLIIFGLFLSKHWYDLNKDLNTNKVYSLTGTVELKIKMGRAIGYRLVIDNVEFNLSGQLYKTLYDVFKKNMDHRIYYAPNSKIILSAEPIYPARNT